MKYLTLITLALTATTAQADFWDNCTAYGGTIITANSYGNDKGGYCNDPNNSNLANNCNGKQFCLRDATPNWWSAFSWCETIGGHLASFYDMCPNTKTNTDSTQGTCANLAGLSTRSAWTSMGWQSNNALYVALSYGTVGKAYSNRTDSIRYSPFCEE